METDKESSWSCGNALETANWMSAQEISHWKRYYLQQQNNETEILVCWAV